MIRKLLSFFSFLAWCLIKWVHDKDKKYEVRLRGKTHRVNSKRVKYYQENHRRRWNKVWELCKYGGPSQCILCYSQLICFSSGWLSRNLIPRSFVICKYLSHRMPYSKPCITVPENERKHVAILNFNSALMHSSGCPMV